MRCGKLDAEQRHPAADDSVAVPRRSHEHEALSPKRRLGLKVRGLGPIFISEVAAVDRADVVRVGEGLRDRFERGRGGGREAQIQAADQVAKVGVHLLRCKHVRPRHRQACHSITLMHVQIVVASFSDPKLL